MAARTPSSPHIRQANWLFVRLAPLVVVVGLLDWLLAPFVLDAVTRDGIVASVTPLGALVLANLVALWLAVHLVFSAFDGVLTERLDTAPEE